MPSPRKRKRPAVQPEDEDDDLDQAAVDQDAGDAEPAKDPAEKENEVWDAIREERYEIVEQLPLTLHRQLSLMRQLDQQAQGYSAKLLPTLREYIELRRNLARPASSEEQSGEESAEAEASSSTKDAVMTHASTPGASTSTAAAFSFTFSLEPTLNLPIPRERTRPPQTSREYLSHIAWLSEELLRASQEKVNLAQATSDSVDRHIRLLDAAIQEQEASLLSSAQGSIHLPDLTLPKPTRQVNNNAFEKYNSITLQTSGLHLNDFGGAKEKDGHDSGSNANGIDSPVDDDGLGMGIPKEVLRKVFVNPMKNEQGEELYCYCNRVSFGEMIACDGQHCALEWFHLGCVGLTEPPEGEWFCENCTKFDM